MELNENQITAAGGLLGGLAGAWLALMAFLRRVKTRAEWKGRMEAGLEQNTSAVLRLEKKVDAGFDGLRNRIDQLRTQGKESHGTG